MPNYEFRCLDCRKRFEKFITFADYGQVPVTCPHCTSENVQRVITKVRVSRGDSASLESMADPAALGALDGDPRTLGRMMKQMSSQLGEDMGGEFNEVVDRLEKGQSPDDIERDMPDLGSDSPVE